MVIYIGFVWACGGALYGTNNWRCLARADDAALDAENEAGWTALACACHHGHLDCAAALLAAGTPAALQRLLAH
jgi:hypothetical protein